MRSIRDATIEKMVSLLGLWLVATPVAPTGLAHFEAGLRHERAGQLVLAEAA
jgi:hypothetical protein